MTKLIAIDARGFTKLSISDKIILTKPHCKKKTIASISENTQTQLTAKEIHLLAIDDFCNNNTEISLFKWESKEILTTSEFTGFFFTSLSSRYLNCLSPPPKA
ncbi:hypothetical protein JKA74_00750 [Marivirga sp. S37H4]|uniref:Uncharacterized protein n=1 Tax=Marivirga aurantiaca TaxID=2802615 RepID=A0A935C4Y0_9BACT|nr:hypothetical protein [Marivirga aurantiaca]MBK6263546.1 hypothetical protein [Marivirga aurantiaca]